MKRTFEHPAPSERELTGPKYWRSLDELAATPGFKAQVEREFPSDASNLNGVDRRQFFKLMAASFALGGVGLAAGCRRPEKHILPYGKSAEDVISGLPLYFASSMPTRKGAIPILAETHEGRPTKIEGNPTYSPYGGASNAFVQASVLDLYDPDRASVSTVKGAAVTAAVVQDLLAKIGTDAAATDGTGLAFLAGQSSSPTRAALVAKLTKKFPKAIWSEYEAAQDEASASAAQAAFGQSVKPVYQLAKAKRIVAIDADFFQSEAHSLYYSREFSKGRKILKKDDAMNRLYAIESTFSLVGSMADHRLRLASSHMLAFVAALAVKLGDTTFAPLAKGLEFKDQDKWLDACAADLLAHKGESVIVAGSHLPPQVHAIAYALNVVLGNVGKTVDFVEVPASTAATISTLASAIKAGSVKTLVILGGNPVYDAPADLDFAALLKSVPDVVRYGYYVDETSTVSGTNLHAAHYLESWGDARTADGTIVPVQPMIMPLFNGLTEIEVLARIVGESVTDPYTQVYNTITGIIGGGNSDHVFRQFLHDGVLDGTAYKKANVRFSAAGISPLFAFAPKFDALSETNLEVRFTFDAKVDDGRFANNGWLQECPDPITKISWDNAILISPKLAKHLKIDPAGSLLQVARKENANYKQGKEQAFIGEVTLNGVTVRGPLHIQPGMSNFTIALPLGYGRTVSGRVGKGVGHNFYPLRTTATLGFATGATLVVKKDELYALANTQEHWSMEGREIVREENFKEDGTTDLGFVNTFGTESHAPSNLGEEDSIQALAKLSPEERAQRKALLAVETPRGQSLYDHPDFTGTHQWGMSIDLNTCIGCNACVIACQAENNIPIVGKDQVLRGREMHWIRLDRYYSDGNIESAAFGGPGNKEIPEDPQVSLQPVACQHCELAPCEIVCPVNATVHDEEGLNTMAYNRCIGTRYCANNCPYKVRRFNFFDWNKRSLDELYMGPLGKSGMPELVKMVKNPDVTVRMRGVMEKCTYCVQRIQQAKIKQKVKAGASNHVEIPDGTIKTACQQVCPVDAVTFGNIKDPTSAVSKAKALQQDYALLGYLNIRPRTTYLGKLRNPNPAMPDYAALPLSRTEYEKKNNPHFGHEPAHGGESGHGEHAPEGEKTEGHSSFFKGNNLFGGLS
jgi:MoCo/4Fe-4S cofactor protein with predicted Tat translocation signal